MIRTSTLAARHQVRTYGCQMNVPDSERLAGLLEAAGYVKADEGAEADVVVFNTCAVRENADNKLLRLVSQGLANNDIATRLFASPRTVQTDLTHVYTKLGLTSRVQLAKEAAPVDDAVLVTGPPKADK